MNKNHTTSPSRFLSIGICSFAMLFAAGTAPIALTGCGENSSSESARANVTNASAPAALPSGMIASTPEGRFTIASGTRYSFTSTSASVSSADGNYTYAANGTDATLTTTPDGGSPTVHELTNFTVTNGNYTSVTVTPQGGTAYTSSLTGTPIAYTEPSNNNGSTNNANTNTPVAGSVYVVTARSTNDPDATKVGEKFTIKSVSNSSIVVTDPAGGDTVLTLKSAGVYAATEPGPNAWTNTVTFSSNATIATMVTTGSGVDAGLSDTYTLTKQ